LQTASHVDIAGDLKFDIETGRLLLSVAPTPDSVVSGEEAALVHLAVFMICEDEVPSAVHDLPEAERATFEQTIANIIAQKALPWRRFLAATCPHRQEVIDAFDKEIAAIIDFGVMDEVLSSDPEYEEAVRLATLCRPLTAKRMPPGRGVW
jgi:hypothetical protein